MKTTITEHAPDARSALMPVVSRWVAVLLLAAGLALFVQHVLDGEREMRRAHEAALTLYKRSLDSGRAGLDLGDLAWAVGGGQYLDLAFILNKNLLTTSNGRLVRGMRSPPFTLSSGDGREIFSTMAHMDADLAQRLRQSFAEAGGSDASEPLRFSLLHDFSYYKVTAVSGDNAENALPGELFLIENAGHLFGGYVLYGLLLLTAGLAAMLLVREAVGGRLDSFTLSRQEAMERLLESEQILESAFNRAETAMALLRLEDGAVIKANARALTLFGASSPEGLDLDRLHEVPAGSAQHRAWLAIGEEGRLMKLATAAGTVYCTVKRSLIGARHDMQRLVLTDVTDMLRLKMESTAHTEYLQRVIDQLPTPMCIKDKNLRLLMHNAAFSRLFGRGENMVGRVRHGAMPDDIMNRLLEADKKAFESGVPISMETDIPLENGETRSLLVSKRVINGRDGQANLLAVCMDISPLKKTERELLELHGRAEAANVAKNEFLACMSHEMRTPLNVILGMTQLARSANPGTSLDRQLRKISEAANNLLETISQILDFANTEAGTVSLNIVPFSLNELLAEVSQKAAGLRLRPGVRFETRIDHFDSDFMGDPRRIAQVLGNLLDNAVKFTHNGFIRLICRSESDQEIYFAVQDSGIGIPEDRMDRMFTGFGQLEGGHSRRYGGSGLGLAITRHFIHLMKGEIGLHSMEDRGSTFFFTLPLSKVEQEGLDDLDAEKNYAARHYAASAAARGANPTLALDGGPDQAAGSGKTQSSAKAGMAGAKTGAGEDGGTSPEAEAGAVAETGLPGADSEDGCSGSRVLVVDDNAENREILRELLGSIGLDCDTATNGRQALEMVGTKTYDLVIMDVQMPVMDGLAATRAIRELPDEALRALPVVALTANALPQDRQACMEAGMNDFLSKPLDVQSLFYTVQYWLDGASTEKAAV